ncbi:uncharacterized protein LOC108607224 isoform X2 [Drosophila busckii]|uniref:uncharacterized protein LOC108607224 isoform X2 n=1 Tax=Drosophila busckii TaxID=30019 RepID=UPI00083E9DD7|nr:uncharacterized protein LOC108607224 isoform X2 [Drosophila busckii]
MEIESKDASRRATAVGLLQPDLKPWQRLDWPSAMQTRIFKNWGQYYAQRLLTGQALKQYDEALALCELQQEENIAMGNLHSTALAVRLGRQHYTTLSLRSKCKRTAAYMEDGWLDAAQACAEMRELGDTNVNLVLDKCDAIYDCGRSEEYMRCLAVEGNKFQGRKIQNRFRLRSLCAHAALSESVGESLNTFLLRNWPVVAQVAQQRLRDAETTTESQTMWEQLKNKTLCDVESVQEKESLSLSPLEQARRRNTEYIYNYTYMRNSAADITLLRQLRSDKNFLNPLQPAQTPQMYQYTTEQYTNIRKFMKIMHARRPLYYCMQEKCLSKRLCEQNREHRLHHIAYQTRRDCHRILRETHRLRAEGNVDRLTNYIDRVMTESIELKTLRILPWKFEFLNEVYNILGMAHIDKCAVPGNLDYTNNANNDKLYLLRSERQKSLTVSAGFGMPNVYEEMQTTENQQNILARKAERLNDRLRHSHYAIERAYLLFEIARCHFKESRFHKCVVMASKSVQGACNIQSVRAAEGAAGAGHTPGHHAEEQEANRVSHALQHGQQQRANVASAASNAVQHARPAAPAHAAPIQRIPRQ